MDGTIGFDYYYYYYLTRGGRVGKCFGGISWEISFGKVDRRSHLGGSWASHFQSFMGKRVGGLLGRATSKASLRSDLGKFWGSYFQSFLQKKLGEILGAATSKAFGRSDLEDFFGKLLGKSDLGFQEKWLWSPSKNWNFDFFHFESKILVCNLKCFIQIRIHFEAILKIEK